MINNVIEVCNDRNMNRMLDDKRGNDKQNFFWKRLHKESNSWAGNLSNGRVLLGREVSIWREIGPYVMLFYLFKQNGA